ncbi:polysaccharide deacetylase family protein [Paenibacillus validus]|uniref:Polysaccharide deacetylase family protein n=1 Tax=Paenibacillus validus TaxID=44253 RepID=A0A7X3CT83_9BACL|nr:polysaccharide deacetylase family protein [Paenibacillus validus]MUG70764.1 polysaccharide deacetylase family protein [Paenibacillus validus]
MTRKLLTGLLVAVILISLLELWGTNPKQTYRDQVAVLMYHHVHDTDQSSSTVSSALFRDQLSYLKKQGYTFISLSEFIRFYEGAPVPEKAVLVTFDDGYRSFYDYAFPILKELDIPAVNFIVTQDLAAPDAPSIPALSRENIRELLGYRAGMFDVQCHSNALHYKAGREGALTGRLETGGGPENEAQYIERVSQDSQACAQRLQELYGSPDAAKAYAYPFGIFSDTAKSLIRDAGFRYAFTIVSEMATRSSNPMEIPRINAGNPSIKPEHLDKQIQLRVERVHKPAGDRSVPVQ